MIKILVIYKNKPDIRNVIELSLEEFIYEYFPKKQKFISSLFIITERDSLEEHDHYLYSIAEEMVSDFNEDVSLLIKSRELLIKNNSIALEVASDKIEKERLETCHDCPQYIHSTDRCDQCSCKVAYKVIFLTSYCPKNKWKT